MTSATPTRKEAQQLAREALGQEQARLKNVEKELTDAITRAATFTTLREEVRASVDRIVALGFDRRTAISHLQLPADLAKVVAPQRRPRQKTEPEDTPEAVTDSIVPTTNVTPQPVPKISEVQQSDTSS